MQTRIFPLVAALALGALPAIAGTTILTKDGESTVITDEYTEAQIERERQVIDIIAARLGQGAVTSSGVNLPPSLDDQIVPEHPLPAGAPVRDLPGDLASELPHSQPGTRFVQVGEHLVELDGNGVAVAVYYDALR